MILASGAPIPMLAVPATGTSTVVSPSGMLYSLPVAGAVIATANCAPLDRVVVLAEAGVTPSAISAADTSRAACFT